MARASILIGPTAIHRNLYLLSICWASSCSVSSLCNNVKIQHLCEDHAAKFCRVLAFSVNAPMHLRNARWHNLGSKNSKFSCKNSDVLFGQCPNPKRVETCCEASFEDPGDSSPTSASGVHPTFGSTQFLRRSFLALGCFVVPSMLGALPSRVIAAQKDDQCEPCTSSWLRRADGDACFMEDGSADIRWRRPIRDGNSTAAVAVIYPRPFIHFLTRFLLHHDRRWSGWWARQQQAAAADAAAAAAAAPDTPGPAAAAAAAAAAGELGRALEWLAAGVAAQVMGVEFRGTFDNMI
jgi:hypothetical protein